MQKLMNWKAKRAGGRITIHAVDQATGKPIKIVGIDTIEASGSIKRNPPVAVHHDGTKYELV